MKSPVKRFCLFIVIFRLFTITGPCLAGEGIPSKPDRILLLIEGEAKVVRLFSNSCLSLAQKNGLKISIVENGAAPFDYRLTLKHEKKKYTELNCYKRDDTRVLFSLKRSFVRDSAEMIRLIASDFVEVIKEHFEFQMMHIEPLPAEVDKLHAPNPGLNKVYKVGGEVSSPKVISRVEPTSTQRAREACIQGSVTLQSICRKDGTIEMIKVVHPLGLGLTEHTVHVMKQWKFEPGMRAGEPVDVELEIVVQFYCR